MARITNQDQAALMDLYQRFGSQVYGLVLRILRDAHLAEEATQDTFLKVWHKAEQWDPSRGQLSSWLLTIARYAAPTGCAGESNGTLFHGPPFWTAWPNTPARRNG
ncbi:MAG: sigma factor [Caldilineales bacterium]